MRSFHFGAALLQLLLLASESAAGPVLKRGGSEGCGQAQTPKKHQSFQSSGGLRHFLVDLPQKYDPNTPSPVIFSYHGHNSDDADEEALDNFNEPEYNSKLQAIVVYPDGLEGTNGGRAWQGAPYSAPNVSDLAFTSDLLSFVQSSYCVDNSRIYASGRSNGAGFVDLLACSPLGSNFAAFAMSAAALYTEAPGGPTCTPGDFPAPILEIHGSDDALIDYYGQEDHGVQLPSIPSWLKTWAERNKCSTTPVITKKKNDNLKITTFDCNGQNDIIEGYYVEGLSHSWPTTTNNDACLDGSKVIIDFFTKHSLP